ncbi:MAG: family 16 glycoside hydrolase [Bacteroidales bacterium]
MKRSLASVALILLGLALWSQDKPTQSVTPGEIWPDTDGNHINAHGGGILFHNGTYYWFGESRLLRTEKDRTKYGVACYSSKDLLKWKNEGLALKVINDTTSMLQPGCVIERPKVIFNKKTGKFIMWFHHELKGQGYRAALTGVAVSETITGPYRYIRSLRPNAGVWPVNLPEEFKSSAVDNSNLKNGSEEWRKAVREGLFVKRDFEGGQMARDMTLFVDSDGKAYHIHSSEENMTLHFSELTDDYLDFTGRYYRVLPGGSNEAPALFFAKGKYFMFTSGTTGWKPNPGRISIADKLTGEWKPLGNPCRGTEDEIKVTFGSQSTFVLQAPGNEDRFIYMGDRWTPENLADSRHIWLPVEWENGSPVIRWYSSWNINEPSGDNVLTDKEIKEGWKLLFDGKTPAQWMNARTKTFPATGWEVKDGTLTINPGTKSPGGGGDIVTRGKYKNFELAVDFNYSSGANSGIKYFVDTEADNGEMASIGCEYQVLDDRLNPDAMAGIEGNRKLASLYDLIAPVNVKDNGPGNWNRAVIIVNGKKVQHWLNGQLTVEYERANPAWRALVAKSKFKDFKGFGEAQEGRLLLQDHGAAVSFRNIKVREF